MGLTAILALNILKIHKTQKTPPGPKVKFCKLTGEIKSEFLKF